MSCSTILFLNLQITRSDIRQYIKWAISLVFVYGHFKLPQGLAWVNKLTLWPVRVEFIIERLGIMEVMQLIHKGII